MLNFRSGNLFHSKMQTLVNSVNTAGVMGKGVALQFRERYPAMFAEYKTLCERGELIVGKLHLYRADDHWILNFPTKRHYRQPSRLKDIETGLAVLRDQYKTWRIESLALPALGCGYGGLSWQDVKRLIQEYLSDLVIPIEVYQPKKADEGQGDEIDAAPTNENVSKDNGNPIQPGLFGTFME